MTYIPSELMETVWQKVGGKAAHQVVAMQKRHRKSQKALAKFVYRHLLLDLREDAAGVGIYAFHVIVEAFSGLSPRPKPVRHSMIDQAWEMPASLLSHKASGAEPHADQYLKDALTEENEVMLTDEERARCARVVQTAVLCLHRACERRP